MSCSCKPNVFSMVGAGPRLTPAQAETPEVRRALADSAIGGVFVGAGLMTLGFTLGQGKELAKNYPAIAAVAAAIVGGAILLRARTSEEA